MAELPTSQKKVDTGDANQRRGMPSAGSAVEGRQCRRLTNHKETGVEVFLRDCPTGDVGRFGREAVDERKAARKEDQRNDQPVVGEPGVSAPIRKPYL